MEQHGQTLRIQNPVFFCPMHVEEVGVIAVITMMSMLHYGLVVCMYDSDLDRDDMETLLSEVATPLVEQMPDFVRIYQQHTRTMIIGDYAPSAEGTEYAMKVISTEDMLFGWPKGVFSPEDVDSLWYIFIAPREVHLEEFISQSSLFLN